MEKFQSANFYLSCIVAFTSVCAHQCFLHFSVLLKRACKIFPRALFNFFKSAWHFEEATFTYFLHFILQNNIVLAYQNGARTNVSRLLGKKMRGVKEVLPALSISRET